ncbi:MAG TPA: S8/S53 family peptidase [Streptosporangiaceae bacterium]
MNSSGYDADRQPSQLEAQIELITGAWAQEGTDIGIAYRSDGDLDFMYQQGVILVRTNDLDEVRRVLGRAFGERHPDRANNAGQQQDPRGGQAPGQAPGRGPGRGEEDHSLAEITLYSLAGTGFSTLEALEIIDRDLGPGVATPNHILSITPVLACPATEPGGVPLGMTPDPGPCDPGPGGPGGGGVSIYVPDTGLLKDAADHHPWLAGVTGQTDKLMPEADGLVIIGEYTGHGTFVAGVARCMAPGAAVHVTDDFTMAGALSEFRVVQKLNQALGLGVDIISLSAGCTTRHNLPLLSFESFWIRYRDCKGVQLVAAAGNNSTNRPFWPAAFPQVVAVGALDSARNGRAYFSDFGSWVDVYAPGENLINAYARGLYIYREPPRIGEDHEFHGMARWSGTSFATPLVSGLIAARMTRTGESAPLAAAALIAAARTQRIPGVGPVLRPCNTGDHGGQSAGCGCGCGCQPRCR